jgi:Ca2+-binding EF-hand superfamily protein
LSLGKHGPENNAPNSRYLFPILLSAPIAFKIFDRDGSGEISYDEFLRSIRGHMNPARTAIAKKVYNVMDTDKSGKVDINDIRQTYNAK